VSRQPIGIASFSGFAAFFLLLFLYITRLLRNIALQGVRFTRLLIYLVSAALYICGILASTLLSGDELGVVSVWMFLLVQISFDTTPLQNLLTVLPFSILYIIISRQTKSVEHWQLDAVYTQLSVSVGLFISYHQSKLALENIIAQSNLQKANFALYHTATTDELTGLMNRRMLFDRYDSLLNECEITGQCLACVVLDIDDYKQFNDSYGHPEGDALLRRIGSVLRKYSSLEGIEIGRIGGEEFLAVWQEEKLSRCERVAEDLRCAVERMAIPHISGMDHNHVTVSVGLCMLPAEIAQGAYLYADKALYRAKDAGKNCACRFDAQSGSYHFLCEEETK
jgi:diguanylate cyclase (GGDEF)-like protein